MTVFDQLHRYWARDRDISPQIVDRIFSRALQRADVRTLEDLLTRHELSAEQRERVSASGSTQVLQMWMMSHQCTHEDRARVIADTSVETLCEMYPLQDKPARTSPDVRALLWERGGDSLRVRVLTQVSWSDTAPAEWGKWLGENLDSPALTPPTLRLLGEHAAEHTWPAVHASAHPRRLEALAAVYAGMGHRAYAHHRAQVTQLLTEGVAEAESSPAGMSPHTLPGRGLLAAAQVLLTGPASRGEVFRLSGSAELALGLRLRALLPLGAHRAELDAMLGVVDEGEAPTREALLRSLRGPGTVPGPPHLEAALAGCAASREDELWIAVRDHPNLTTGAAADLLRALGRTSVEVVESLLASHSRAWRIETAKEVWRSPHARPQFPLVHKALKWDERSEVLRQIVTEDPGQIHALSRSNLVSSSVIGALPACQISTVVREHSREILQLTRYHLGDEGPGWEVAEALVDEYTGTYEDLLKTAKAALTEP